MGRITTDHRQDLADAARQGILVGGTLLQDPSPLYRATSAPEAASGYVAGVLRSGDARGRGPIRSGAVVVHAAGVTGRPRQADRALPQRAEARRTGRGLR